jgi:hypothetical protein
LKSNSSKCGESKSNARLSRGPKYSAQPGSKDKCAYKNETDGTTSGAAGGILSILAASCPGVTSLSSVRNVLVAKRASFSESLLTEFRIMEGLVYHAEESVRVGFDPAENEPLRVWRLVRRAVGHFEIWTLSKNHIQNFKFQNPVL